MAELTPEEKAKQMDADLRAADAKRRADAEEKERATGETLDKILQACDALSRKMTDWEEKEQAKADEAAAAREKSDPMPLAADSLSEPYKGAPMEIKDNTLCDAMGDPIPCAHQARVDGSIRVDSLVRANTEASYRNDAATAQARCDRVTQVYSQSAPPIMTGETIRAYKVRLINLLKPASPAYKAIESEELAKMSPATFAIAENTIYADADRSGRNPAVPEGQLFEYFVTDQAGRKISMFAGESRAWLRDFACPRKRLVGIRNRND
jgi:hypothetical protein